ncbi:hypothetical protein FRC17_008288 [Serendipita sp. 399]|nr:hypothetical protein FRC17_008288 [Serendipita sp. 399]
MVSVLSIFTLFLLHILPVFGSALPERPALPGLIADLEQEGHHLERRDWGTTPCPDGAGPSPTTKSETVVHGEVVTVTVSVFVPASSPFTSLGPPPTLSTRSTTTATSTSTSTSTGVGPASSLSATASASAVGNTLSPSSNPSSASGLDAQRLNVAFSVASDTDACAVGQRACIDNMIAECLPSSSSSQPQWITRACPVSITTNEGLTCAAVPIVPSSSSSSSSAPPPSTTSTSGGVLEAGTTFLLTDSIALGCFTKEDISQRFASSGVQGGMLGLTSGASPLAGGWDGHGRLWSISGAIMVLSWILASTTVV